MLKIGDKVKIKVKNLLKNKKSYNKDFINFLESNINTVFLIENEFEFLNYFELVNLKTLEKSNYNFSKIDLIKVK